MKTSTIVYIGVGIGLACVGGYIANEFWKLYNAKFRILFADGISITPTSISFTLYAEIENTSDISVKAKSQKYEVYLGDQPISLITKEEKLNLRSHSKVPFTLQVKINTTAVKSAALKTLALALTDKSKVLLSIRGSLLWKAGIISAKTKVDVTFSLQELIDMGKKKP